MTLACSLDGRTAIVTGGTRGIGRAIAELLSEAGADVVITGTGRPAPGGDAAFPGLRYQPLDFVSETSLDEFIHWMESLNSLDILVNNAGVNRILPADEVTSADYDWMHAVNLRGPLLLSSRAIPVMRRGQWGRIVNIASIWSVITRPGRSMYTTTKSGLVGLTRTLAVENAEHGILVNTISPDFTMTDLTRSTLTPDEIVRLGDQVPIRRFAEPAEIAQVVLFLCSDLNTYMTGQNITVDGGYVSV